MAVVGKYDEAAEAQEAHLDAFLDHLINVVALSKDFSQGSPTVQIERKMAKSALRDAIGIGHR